MAGSYKNSTKAANELPIFNAEHIQSNTADGVDSNAVILPNRKKQKKSRECMKRERGNDKKLSKSQKRKLRRLEEEKAKEHLLLKSVEILQKSKLNEDVYKLMWSSKSIGQVDTSKEKRRRIMNYSKAGLEVPCGSLLLKRSLSDDRSGEMESDHENSLPKINNITDTLFHPCERAIQDSTFTCQESCNEGSSRAQISVSCEYVAKQLSEEVVEKNDVLMLEHGKCSSSNHSPLDKKLKDHVSLPLTDNGHGMVSTEDFPDQQGAPSVPTVIYVKRPDEVECKRKDLPIVMMEQEIMEAINENLSVIICGETGCGKTTQVPQFLYEAGFGSKISSIHSGIIGVTQPRRVAVLATARRVAYELGVRLGREVGFQVRYDKKIGENSSIKFMTDGILLREVQNDFLLKHYSVLILDEAHERSLNTDILIGMLSRVIRQRQVIYREQQRKLLCGETIDPENRIFPLKLILMSATLRIEDFTCGQRIFHQPPPVIEVPTRQYPVTSHFSKRTEIVDYIGQAYRKILQIHKKLPLGGILVFVTGQREVEYLCSKLRKASKELVRKNSHGNVLNQDAGDTNAEDVDANDMKEFSEALDADKDFVQQQTDRFSSYEEPHEQLDDDESDFSYHSESDSDLEFESDCGIPREPDNHGGDGDITGALGDQLSLEALQASFASLAGQNESKHKSEVKKEIPDPVASDAGPDKRPSLLVKGAENDTVVGPMHVLPLYAMLPAAAQLRVFGDVKEGERLVVVATNVAETSLTIPGIKYVVDTGREKVKKYNSLNGVESYEIQWVSKASAAQRSGRAGRTGPGHCYRLYSSAVFSNQFSDFSCAEISKVPVDGVVLLMKSMGIGKVANFPFPTPPDATALVEADRCLKALDALDNEGRLTPLGKMMARYPMSPRHSRMLLTAIQTMNRQKKYIRSNLVLGYAVAAAAALSLSNPFIFQFEGDNSNLEQDKKSDFLTDDKKTLEKQQKLIRKKWKENAILSYAKYSSMKSDALTVAYALQCFELSDFPSEFCTGNALHLKTMEEMSKLRKQLLQLVFNQSRAQQDDYLWNQGALEDVEEAWRVPCERNPLTQIEENLLLQAICSGWVDRVAKRVSRSKQLLREDTKANSVPYQATMIEERVYLHRRSSVSKLAPEFMVYSELLHTKRPYIHGASCVESEWLVRYASSSLCTFSAPLADPKPGYDYLTDQVYCYVTPYFGPQSWELPFHKVPINDVTQRVAVFAYALLDGQVLPCLKIVRPYMAAPPNSVLKPEALGQKRIGNLLSKLQSRSRTIDCCAMLRKVWEENPMELHQEISCWFQSGFQYHFAELWVSMQREAFLSTMDRFPSKSKKRKVVVG